MNTTDDPTLENDIQPIKFHQRLTHSLSIRTSSSSSTSQLHRSQSFVFDDKFVGRHGNRGRGERGEGKGGISGFNLLWRQQSSMSTSTRMSLDTPPSSFTSSAATIKRPTSKHHLDKDLPPIQGSYNNPLDRLLLESTPPTLKEFYSWIHDYLTPLSKSNHIISISKLVIAKDCLYRLLDNVDDETFARKITLKNQLQRIEIPTQPASTTLSVLAEVLRSLLSIFTALKPTINYPTKLIDTTGTTSPYTLETPCITPTSNTHTPTFTDSEALWPDHLTENTHWFRDYFCGKDYTTLLIPINKTASNSSPTSANMYAVVNAIVEPNLATALHNNNNDNNNNNNNDNNTAFTTTVDYCDPALQYRLIIRLPENATMRYLVSNAQARDYQSKREGHPFGLQKPIKQQRRSLRANQGLSTMKDLHHHHLLAAAILSVCPELNMTKAIYLPTSTTLTCQLEKDLLRLDNIEVPPAYKFGILTIKNNQTKEEEWFANTGVSKAFDSFLKLLGNRIQLKGYKGYAAGLDTRTGETGDTSVISKWKDYEIMFHVGPLMPFHQTDKQQVQRKRYIGNDIVCLVFLEGDATFDPRAIRSKFLHVFLVVRREVTNQKHRWRVEVVRKSNVPEFGPSLPSPPLFYDDQVLKSFLTLKLINAENAALKCDNFSVPNNRARSSILEGIVQKALNQEDAVLFSSTLTITKLKRQQSRSQPQRPKSSTNNRLSHNSMRSIRSNPDRAAITTNSSVTTSNANHNDSKANDKRTMDAPAPPIPSPTRSTMLQDLKNFALRRAPTFSSLHHRSSPVKETVSHHGASSNGNNASSDKNQASYTHPALSVASDPLFHQDRVSNDDPVIQRSILAAKAKSPFFKSSGTSSPPPSPPPVATSSYTPSFQQQSDGLRYRTQNLMINVVGRRASTRPIVPSLVE